MTPTLPNGLRLFAFERLDSTNAFARRLAEAGDAMPSVVWALEQSAGAGRRGRAWHSPRGNLYVSLLLVPGRPLAAVAQLSFAAALAVGEAIEALAPPGRTVRFKWPNDVLLDGAKIAGILLEAGDAAAAGASPWLVVGVGINLDSHPPETPYPATHVAAAGGEPNIEKALEVFVRAFLVRWERWLTEGFEPIRAEWLAKAFGRGTTIRVNLERDVLSGTFDGVDESGALVLGVPGGHRSIAAGEIFFGAG
ncbi:MAG: biotin--[acetyl-CoA-carboxylase] ligase [Proteobacteria bacterium]|nr:biotin--[acetyl-CoA-carboxylase] ligase [Pseudomonadota bacterium]MBI3498905.1 biotin--[acetyl-CoA-carboxylase] ligase [Pseudomonadota bacterium]